MGLARGALVVDPSGGVQLWDKLPQLPIHFDFSNLVRQMIRSSLRVGIVIAM